MNRASRLPALVLMLLWFLASETRVPAFQVQCRANHTARLQENFSPSFNGWYCSSLQQDSQYVCENDRNTFCGTACDECYGVNSDATNAQCHWERSAGPGPDDPTAQTYGCNTPNPWAELYQIDCTCSAPPSCVQEGGACGGVSGQPPTCCSGLYCNEYYEMTCQTFTSPILIDLKSNSVEYHLTSAPDGVSFDIDADGTLEQVAWTEPDSRVAFLTLDRNGNGTIDDGSELFGTASRMRDGQRAGNGFIVLADLDSDGRINSSDALYHQLRLWFDLNHNGISEPNELLTLEQAGVDTIFTEYWEQRRLDKHGNAYLYEGRATIAKNAVPRRLFDVFLQVVPQS